MAFYLAVLFQECERSLFFGVHWGGEATGFQPGADVSEHLIRKIPSGCVAAFSVGFLRGNPHMARGV